MARDEIDIKVRDLVMRYGANTVLKDVNLDICSGCVTCILGPSGCGKSTLLKAMLGLVTPSAGYVRMLGRDVTGMEREELSSFLTRVGVTFQHGALFGSETIGDNVATPLRVHTRLDEDTIWSIVEVKLAQVGLEEAIYSYPSELSGGMQKRAALARALALDPRILLFDEPSAGLDPETADDLDELILQLNQTLGATFVIVTHEIRSALRISDRIVFLSEGDVQVSGTVEDFLESSNENARRFMAASDFHTATEKPAREGVRDDNPT